MTWCSVVLRVASLCYALQAGRPLVFAFGNELVGISDGLRHAAHARVRLDMRGMAQSYNVSVTCAILLEHVRLRHPALLAPNLSGDRRCELLARWLLREVGFVQHPAT
jgi:tRNA (guanosine-2'-O-)-methyltransferase